MVFLFSSIKRLIMLTGYVMNIGFGEREKYIQMINTLFQDSKIEI